MLNKTKVNMHELLLLFLKLLNCEKYYYVQSHREMWTWSMVGQSALLWMRRCFPPLRKWFCFSLSLASWSWCLWHGLVPTYLSYWRWQMSFDRVDASSWGKPTALGDGLLPVSQRQDIVFPSLNHVVLMLMTRPISYLLPIYVSYLT